MHIGGILDMVGIGGKPLNPKSYILKVKRIWIWGALRAFGPFGPALRPVGPRTFRAYGPRPLGPLGPPLGPLGPGPLGPMGPGPQDLWAHP